MGLRETIEVVLAILLVVNLVVLGAGLGLTLRRVGRLSEQAERFLKQVQEEVTATLQQAHDTLARAEQLSVSTERVVREQVGPTLEATRAALGHVEAATRGVNDTVQGVRRVVGGVEAVSGPAAVVGAASRLLQTPAGRAGLLTLALGAAARALMTRRRT